MRKLAEYKLYIRLDHEDTLGCVATDICEATWRAGHYAHAFRRRQGASENDQIEEDTRETDVFVSVSQQPSEAVRMECTKALADGKAVLALVVGTEARPGDFEELKRVVDRYPGSLVERIVTMTPEIIVTEYLIALHKVTRILDRSRLLLEQGIDPEIPNRFVRKVARVGRVLSRRCEENSFLKQGIADFFYQNNYPRLIQADIKHLFLESGSSIAYVAETLAEELHSEWTLSKPELQIDTNNILAYLVLAWAVRKIRISLHPSGRPDDKYGATLGTLLDVEPERGGSIDGDARREMCRIKDYFKDAYKDDGILFGATSGIDLGSEFPGFHTGGSYPMMLFKRALLEAAMEAEIPLVMFADEDKIPYAFNPSKCYSICDSDLPWDTVCEDVPLAIACAFRSQERAKQVLPRLIELGFTEGQQESDGKIPWSVIAANGKFLAASKGWFRARRLTLGGANHRSPSGRPASKMIAT